MVHDHGYPFIIEKLWLVNHRNSRGPDDGLRGSMKIVVDKGIQPEMAGMMENIIRSNLGEVYNKYKYTK